MLVVGVLDLRRHRAASTSTASSAGGDGALAVRSTDRPICDVDDLRDRRSSICPIACGPPRLAQQVRYFLFPIAQCSLEWWQRTIDLIEIGQLVRTSLIDGGRASPSSPSSSPSSARSPMPVTTGRGRSLYQKLVLLPIFFPQPVMGLALLLWFNALGMHALLADGGLCPSRLDRAGRHPRHGDPDLRLRPGAGGGRLRSRRHARTGPARSDAADPVAGDSGPARSCLPPELGELPAVAHRPAPTPACPEWLYAKMVAGYTPMVPALGSMATIAAAAVLLVAGLLLRLRRRRAEP